MTGRRLAAFVVVMSAVVAGLLAPATAQSTAVVDDAAILLEELNAARSARGLPQLRSDPHLVSVARRWAEHIAAQGRLSHSRLHRRVGVEWSVLGENVGRGPAPGPIHRGLLASPAHRRNILDARFDRVGIGTARHGAELYVTQVFLRGPSGGAPPIPGAGGSR